MKTLTMPNDSSQSDLQIKLVREMIGFVMNGTLKAGDHLREIELSERLGVSRTPTRAALTFLSENGLVEKRANKGFFWTAEKARCARFLKKLPRTDEEILYETIAKDWFEGKIEKDVSEAVIRKRYQLGRLTAQRILNRLADEGVVSRMPDMVGILSQL